MTLHLSIVRSMLDFGVTAGLLRRDGKIDMSQHFSESVTGIRIPPWEVLFLGQALQRRALP